MADVKFEHKESLPRERAAIWLTALSRAFSHGGEVSLPVGEGTLGLHLPEHVQAEFEVEVDGDEVQVELEFTWSTAKHPAGEDD